MKIKFNAIPLKDLNVDTHNSMLLFRNNTIGLLTKVIDELFYVIPLHDSHQKLFYRTIDDLIKDGWQIFQGEVILTN